MEKSKSPITEKRIPTERVPVPAREPPRPGTARIVRRRKPWPTESLRKWGLSHRSSGSTRGDTCNSKAPRIRSAAPGRVVSQDRKASGSGIGPRYASKSGPGSVRPFVVRGDFLRRCPAFSLRSARTVEWRSIIGRPAGRRTSSSSGTRARWSGRSGSAAPFPQIQGRIPRPILTEALVTPDSTVPGARYLPDTYPNRSPNHHYPDSGYRAKCRSRDRCPLPPGTGPPAARRSAPAGPGNGSGGVRPVAGGPVSGSPSRRRRVPPPGGTRPGRPAAGGRTKGRGSNPARFGGGSVTRPPAARGLSGR